MKHLSVIIPTKNRNEFLRCALEPFKHFTENIEIIVVDDGSCPEKALLNKRICSTITSCQYYYFKISKGAAAARNYGLSVSNHNYIWFLDDDDVASTQAIKDVLATVSGDSSSYIHAILLPMVRMFGNTIVSRVFPSEGSDNFECYKDRGHTVNTSCAIFSRKVLTEIGGWDESLIAGQDTDLFLRVAQVVNFECLNTEPVIVSVGHSKRITRLVFRQQLGRIQFLRKHWRILTTRRRLYYILTFIICVPCLYGFERSFVRVKQWWAQLTKSSS